MGSASARLSGGFSISGMVTGKLKTWQENAAHPDIFKSILFDNMMSKLKNGRHERFAQALATGRKAEEAFHLAGYRECGKAAEKRIARLQADENIRKRADAIGKGIAEKNPVTVAMLTEGLLRIARDCETSDAATAKNVARSAYMDIARLNGLVGERNEGNYVSQEITDQPLSEKEWSERYTGE